MIWSTAASGNFRGALVVSISKAMTTGSAGASRSSLRMTVVTPFFASTKYQLPARMSAACQPSRLAAPGPGIMGRTHVYHYSDVVRDVVFPDIDNVVARLGK